jgi:hypothetical protein
MAREVRERSLQSLVAEKAGAPEAKDSGKPGSSQNNQEVRH